MIFGRGDIKLCVAVIAAAGASKQDPSGNNSNLNERKLDMHRKPYLYQHYTWPEMGEVVKKPTSGGSAYRVSRRSWSASAFGYR